MYGDIYKLNILLIREYHNEKILLLSSLISLAVVFYLGIPNKNMTVEVSKIDKSTFTSPSVDESVNDDVPLKFDIVVRPEW